jgi:hypothetical protein
MQCPEKKEVLFGLLRDVALRDRAAVLEHAKR